MEFSRNEVQVFAGTCERLLYAHSREGRLTKDQVALVSYYVTEVAKAIPEGFNQLPEPREDLDYDLDQLSLSLLLS